MKTSVLKDGHIFVVHIVDPKEPSEEEEEVHENKQDGEDKESVTEKADQEKSEKEDKTTAEGIVNDFMFHLNCSIFIINYIKSFTSPVNTGSKSNKINKNTNS